MSKIFISYRQDDSADVCDGIYRRLAAHFGKDTVFRDIHNIPYGADFRQVIENSLQDCVVELVVIGPRWLDIKDKQGHRRLDEPNDVVRLEVETGLRRGIVIPVLVHGAALPARERLPDGLEELPTKNIPSLGSDLATDRVFGRLITQIRGQLKSGVSSQGFTRCQIDGALVIIPPVVEVPGGAFQMGGSINENEKPVRTVVVPEFAIGVHPVTVAEYDCFVRSGHSAPPQSDIGWQSGSWQSQLGRSDHPVVNVTWHDATAYAAWLAERTGQAWRLPNEAEWEKAASCDADTGSAHVYPWGDRFEATRCNTTESGKHTTTAIGTFHRGASPCGAQDMAGNVWEWTSSSYGTPSDERRTKRGGSYADSGPNARAARRVGESSRLWTNSIGFRLALGMGS